MIIILKSLISIFFVIFFTACSSKVIVEPTINKKITTNKKIYAKLIGKKTFIPNIIVEDNNSLLSINYEITEKYNISGKDTDVLNIFNPLVLVGFPLGDNLILISSNLKFIKDNNIIKEYNAQCLHESSRNLFGNPDYTLMRNKCLEELRSNINSQIINHIKKGKLNEIQ